MSYSTSYLSALMDLIFDDPDCSVLSKWQQMGVDMDTLLGYSNVLGSEPNYDASEIL